ncbi:MAG: hypothetical protein R2847_02400 [Bacteroidia bacterium]
MTNINPTPKKEDMCLQSRYHLWNQQRIWFDYLRDNMTYMPMKWFSVHHYAIVDEVDELC